MIVVVCGPTGVGKTKLSVELARKYNGIVVNADASQVYKYLNIGTSKVTEEEKCGVEHYLFDILDVNEDYSVSDYQCDARALLEKYKDRNIILVGGTGLYICAALTDYRFNEKIEIDLSKYSNEELYENIKKINSEVEIDVNNRRRLENFLLSGKDKIEKPKELYKAIYIGLTTDRNYLYERINKRVDQMVDEGLVEEVKSLYEKYGDTRILNSSIGYKELLPYIKGECSLEDSLELIKKNTRHYAKRQYTWFNNKMDVKWFNTDYKKFDNTVKDVINYINEKD